MSTHSKENDSSSTSQLKVYIRMRPMRNNSSKRAMYVIDKGLALNYK